jgi:DNA-binding transcriptional LysR family regulator
MEQAPRPRLEDLHVFVHVIERGGLSAAARDLHLTPGAVSKQVARLERVLGAHLLERSTRSMRLTDEGRAAAEQAREILALVDRLGETTARGRTALRGTIRLTAPAPFGRKYVAPAVAEFRRLHPAVDFEVQLGDRVVDLLASGVDLALRIGHLPDSGLLARRLAPSRRVLVASPAYLARHLAPRHPRDLAGHACLVLAYPGSLQDRWTLRRGRQRAAVTVGGGMRSDSGEVLRDWCARGLGISLRETWDLAGRDGAGLVRVLPAWEAEPTSLHAVRPRRDPLPVRIAAFLDFLADRWKSPPWNA